MCGRYSQTQSLAKLQARFGLREPKAAFELLPRYNLAPTQTAPVVRRLSDGTRALDLQRWGLVPSWAKDASLGAKMINARAETVAEKPAYRRPFRERRCLVPADGWYEWAREKDEKTGRPHRLSRPTQETFAFAGLWDAWTGPDGKELRTFTVLTTEASPDLRAVHERMPVVLAPEDEAAWLDPATPPERALALARPAPEGTFRAYPVSSAVNSPKNDVPELIRELQDADG